MYHKTHANDATGKAPRFDQLPRKCISTPPRSWTAAHSHTVALYPCTTAAGGFPTAPLSARFPLEYVAAMPSKLTFGQRRGTKQKQREETAKKDEAPITIHLTCAARSKVRLQRN